MSAEVYAIVASAARYWFLFLITLIVWRSFVWLRKDMRARKRRVKHLPDAGFVGELIVLEGSDALPVGTALPLPREGVLGNLRQCDVIVPVDGVLGKHVAFRFQDGLGLLVEPYYQSDFLVDGEETENRNKPLVMFHGSRLQVGEALLRMRLFVGVEAMRPSTVLTLQKEPMQTETYAVIEEEVYRQRMQEWQTDQFAPVHLDDEVYEDDDFDEDEEYEEYEEYEDYATHESNVYEDVNRHTPQERRRY